METKEEVIDLNKEIKVRVWEAVVLLTGLFILGLGLGGYFLS